MCKRSDLCQFNNNSYAAKILKKELHKALKAYLKGDFDRSLERIKILQGQKLSLSDYQKLRRVLDVLLIGELYGLHTLKQILGIFGIKSTNLYRLWREYDFHQIKRYSTTLCLDYFEQELKTLLPKSDSTWSRSEVTVIIDDSIFKQWLKNMPRGHYFSSFFSGQVKRSVYGFRVLLIGVALGDNFYPLHFQLVPKKSSPKKSGLNLLKKVEATFVQLTEREGVEYPNLFLSADSGFTDEDLIRYCERKKIGFIGVPKKNNVFSFGQTSMNLSRYIKEIFLPKEKKYQEKNKGRKKPFFMRVRAYYQAQDREVVLLFFRLAGSNKVTVIFCQQKEVMAKTMRRRFFQRTKIELFFRFLKDTLKIQTSKSERYGDFVKKLSLFMLKAIICLKFERACRRKKRFRGWAFSKIRQQIIYQQVDIIFLKNAIFNSPFA